MKNFRDVKNDCELFLDLLWNGGWDEDEKIVGRSLHQAAIKKIKKIGFALA